MKATGCYHSRKTISTMKNQINAMLSFNYNWPNEHNANKAHYFFIKRMGYFKGDVLLELFRKHVNNIFHLEPQ
jgi:hypothetical protein